MLLGARAHQHRRAALGGAFVRNDGVFGQQFGEDRAKVGAVELARFGRKTGRSLHQRRLCRGLQRIGQPSQRGQGIFAHRGEPGQRGAGRGQPAGFARIGEERHRRFRPAEHNRLELCQVSLCLLTEIGQLLDRDPAHSALVAGGESLRDQPRASGGGDPSGLHQCVFTQRPSAQIEALGAFAGFQRFSRSCNRRVGGFGGSGHHWRRDCSRSLGPGVVGRDYHGRHLAGIALRHGKGFGPGLREVTLAARDADPVRHRLRDAFGVRGQRGVEMLVIGGVLANHVDHRAAGLAGIVEVGEAIAEAGAEVQQSHCRFIGHAPITISRAGHHAFEQAEYRAHPVLTIDRCNQLHLRRAGVGKADLYAASVKRLDKGLCTVHVCYSSLAADGSAASPWRNRIVPLSLHVMEQAQAWRRIAQ